MSKIREKPTVYQAKSSECLRVAEDAIHIRGARVHNLRDISVDIPHGKLTVITGVSGSGKSSLAFDTLYAEGQRQYIESLSAYARQFLDQIPRPDVDFVEGLQPTLCIDQKTSSTHPRSTVSTVTEIHDYLRLLYARAGVPHCTGCGEAITHQSPDMILDWLRSLEPETKVVLLAPMIRGRRGTHREVFEQMAANGWLRARVDGEIYPLDQLPELAPRKLHTIEAVVDRLVIRQGNEDRLTESANTALRFGEGVMTALYMPPGSEAWQERLLSTLFACPQCGKSFQELEPRSFSFNSPYGACESCDGLGYEIGETCASCNGHRLKPESLAVTLLDRSIAQLSACSIADLIDFFATMVKHLPTMQQAIGRPIATEVASRLKFLDRVGVGYLSLDRPANTLSGGELQRVRLATSIGSGLVGVCYVLDEPSIGLHPCDNDRLIESIRDLQRQGNTIVVVEHDEAMMWASDHLIDMGPGAGSRGGQIISQGTPVAVAADEQSITGRYLAKVVSVNMPSQRRAGHVGQALQLCDVTTHNLKKVTATFPLGMLIGVTGVSGSGKSSLVNDTLVPALAQTLRAIGRPVAISDEEARPSAARYRELRGVEFVDKLIPIDQSPIGRGPRSCPATYAGALDEIRKVFAATREAKQRGFTSSRFSFNAADGRCDLCKGQGSERIEMNFLSDLLVTCTRCGGKRFNRQTLMVRFKGKNVADVLDMTIDEAAEFFENFPKISRLLTSLSDIGLGYVRLGQSSTTLSGGEAQRIKLGTELARVQTGRTVYVLDEPTTGLHFADVARLLSVLQRLVDAGNTVIVIEHNLDIIKACDWLLDIGPVGGAGGGQIVGEGTPETIASQDGNVTGRYLRELLGAVS